MIKKNFFEIPRTIYSKSERSEHFLNRIVFSLFPEVSQIEYNGPIIIQIGKIIGIYKSPRKVRKSIKPTNPKGRLTRMKIINFLRKPLKSNEV